MRSRSRRPRRPPPHRLPPTPSPRPPRLRGRRAVSAPVSPRPPAPPDGGGPPADPALGRRGERLDPRALLLGERPRPPLVRVPGDEDALALGGDRPVGEDDLLRD